MRELLNIFTAGAEGINLDYNQERSLANVPINEDYAMIVEVTAVNSSIVSGKKVWDEAATPKTFYAVLKYHGKNGTPPDSSIEIGQHVVFYRVGDFNSQGTSGFELHVEDATKCSFVCFVSEFSFIYVQDQGDGTGTQVGIDEFGDPYPIPGAENLIMETADPDTFFHNSNPPFQGGRVYPAQKISGEPQSIYVVFLQAKGPVEEIFQATVGSDTFNLSVDGQGNVIDFSVS